METTPPAPEPNPLPPVTSTPSPEEKQWKVILHLSALAGVIVPCGNIIGPLVVWLIKKQEMPVLEPEGRKVLNFQISATIYLIASVIIATVASCLIVPILLPIIIGIGWIVYTIIGGIKASNNEAFEFPLTIKML